HLPGLLRTALSLHDRDLAGRLADGVQPTTPLHEHALATCRAQLAEADPDHAQAAQLYQEAADRWQQFGNVPEHAYALLGQGRSLLALDHAGAEVPLRNARDLFVSIGYKPALAETVSLLGEAAASR